MYASQQAVRSQQREGGSRQAAACPVRGRGARHPHSHFLSPHLAQQGQEAAGTAAIDQWTGWIERRGRLVGLGGARTGTAAPARLTPHAPDTETSADRGRCMGREHRLRTDGRTTSILHGLRCRWHAACCALPALVASWVFVPAGDNKFRIDLSPSWTAAIQREVEKRVRTVTGRGMAWPGPAPSGSPRPCSLFLFRCRLFAPSHLS